MGLLLFYFFVLQLCVDLDGCHDSHELRFPDHFLLLVSLLHLLIVPTQLLLV